MNKCYHENPIENYLKVNLSHFCQSITGQAPISHANLNVSSCSNPVFSMSLTMCDLDKFSSVHLQEAFSKPPCHTPIWTMYSSRKARLHPFWSGSIHSPHIFCSPAGPNQFVVSFPYQIRNLPVFILSSQFSLSSHCCSGLR